MSGLWSRHVRVDENDLRGSLVRLPQFTFNDELSTKVHILYRPDSLILVWLIESCRLVSAPYYFKNLILVLYLSHFCFGPQICVDTFQFGPGPKCSLSVSLLSWNRNLAVGFCTEKIREF